MKNIIMRSLLLAVFAISAPVQAGPGHAHDKHGGHGNHGHGPVTEEQVKAKAKRTMLNLVKRKVIDQSWTSANPSKAEKKTFAKGEEWVVSFQNTQIKDKSKQTLYIFFSLNGHYIAANYSGK